MSSLEAFNTLEETAAYLRLKPTQVVRLARQKKIAHFKEGNTFVFPGDGVEAYAASKIIAPLPANPHGLSDAALRRFGKVT